MAGRDRHRRLVLPLRGRVLLGLCALATTAAIVTGDADTRFAAALLGAPLLVDLLLKPRGLGTVEVQVAPRRTIAGAPFLETVTLRSHLRTPLRDLMVHEPRISRDLAAALVDRLDAATPQSVQIASRSQQRSVQAGRTFELRTGWPFGLCWLAVRRSVPSPLVTEPARTPPPRDLLATTDDDDDAAAEWRHPDGAEFHSLREHQWPEDARHVHARRSAALGSLVRTVRHGCEPDAAILVVDLRCAPERPSRRPHHRFEALLSLAAGLIDHRRARAAELQVLLLAADDRAFSTAAPADAARLFEALAGAAPAAARSLDAGTLPRLQAGTRCYWIAANGWLDQATLAQLPRSVVVAREGA